MTVRALACSTGSPALFWGLFEVARGLRSEAGLDGGPVGGYSYETRNLIDVFPRARPGGGCRNLLLAGGPWNSRGAGSEGGEKGGLIGFFMSGTIFVPSRCFGSSMPANSHRVG